MMSNPMDWGVSPNLLRQASDARIIRRIRAHQDIGENHVHAAIAQQACARQGALERPGHFRDPVVHLGTMGIDAHLDSVKAQLRQAVRLLFPDHDGVRLDLDAEQQ